MASIIIKNAAKGQDKAMTALYEANKQTVYFIARYLLSDESQAVAATAAAFRETWSAMKSAKLSTPQQFTALAISKVADQCKRAALKKNPKALRVPHSKNFLLQDNAPVRDTQDSELTYLLCNLPAFHRYILVLHTLGQQTELQIATLLGLDPGTVRDAIGAEAENLQKLQQQSAKGYSSTHEQLTAALTHPAGTVSDSADKACRDTIATIAAAAEKALQKQKKTGIIIAVIAVFCAALITVGAILATGSDSSDQAEGGKTGTFTSSSDGTSSNTNTDADTDAIPQNSAPALDESLTYYADIDIADYGRITVKLNQSAAPATAANFVNLAQNGFYDGLTFHRIKEGFVMQGGCPNGNGLGGADENVVGEFKNNGYDNPLSHIRGTISMARSDDPNSASSQFFIVHEDSTFLDGDYAAFGYVTEGINVVDAVCSQAKPTDDNGTIPASAQPVITSVTIRTESAQ